MTSHVKDVVVPAAGFRWLTHFYDPTLSWVVRERTWRPRLVSQVDPKPQQRILDLGCGTGTLAIMLRQACQEADIIGLDADQEALHIARGKAHDTGAAISFWHGRADDPTNVPMFRAASFDKIVSCLLIHHLRFEQKHRALAHARSLLRPGGELHVADWGPPANALLRFSFSLVHMLDRFPNTSENAKGLLPDMMRAAEFAGVTETHRHNAALGTLYFHRAVR